MQLSTLFFNFGNKNRWFCCKLCVFILFFYIVTLHILLLIYRRDLEWMPPRPDDLSQIKVMQLTLQAKNIQTDLY
uniref:Ovule protein n=1 Tax=Meloidogyne incognita TaxID=6306 RepID=A0A914LVJ5_MELIC